MRRQRKSKYKSRFYRFSGFKTAKMLASRWKIRRIKDLPPVHGLDVEAELLKSLTDELKIENFEWISDYLNKMLKEDDEKTI